MGVLALRVSVTVTDGVCTLEREFDGESVSESDALMLVGRDKLFDVVKLIAGVGVVELEDVTVCDSVGVGERVGVRDCCSVSVSVFVLVSVIVTVDDAESSFVRDSLSEELREAVTSSVRLGVRDALTLLESVRERSCVSDGVILPDGLTD